MLGMVLFWFGGKGLEFVSRRVGFLNVLCDNVARVDGTSDGFLATSKGIPHYFHGRVNALEAVIESLQVRKVIKFRIAGAKLLTHRGLDVIQQMPGIIAHDFGVAEILKRE
jgi:hypothetical protein